MFSILLFVPEINLFGTATNRHNRKAKLKAKSQKSLQLSRRLVWKLVRFQYEHNTQRRNDIDRFAQAAIEYQKHNSGKLPFRGTDYDVNFVPKYIDSSCRHGSTHSYNFGSSFASNVGSYVRNIRYTNCSEAFTDPDGTAYQIYHLMSTPSSEEGQYVFSDKTISSNEFRHAVLLISRSGCGSTENTVIKKNGNNDFAIIMKLEGGSVYCVDNS